MQGASFIEILVEQIRDEVRADVMQEFAMSGVHARSTAEAAPYVSAHAHQASQTELWLSLHLQPKVSPRGAYGMKGAPQTSARSPGVKALSAGHTTCALETERRGSVQTSSQILALEFFKREGASIGLSFSESEFKTAFRKLAMVLHPDRHMQASEKERAEFQLRFARLTECAGELAATLA